MARSTTETSTAAHTMLSLCLLVVGIGTFAHPSACRAEETAAPPGTHAAPAQPGVGEIESALPQSAPERSAIESTPLELSVPEAVLMAFGSNVALHIERLQPVVREEHEQIERSVFDPHLTAGVSASNITGATEENALSARAGVTRQFSTGTRFDAGAGADHVSAGRNDRQPVSVDLQLTQALLRGRGRETNLARLRQATIDTRISRYELRGVAETLLAAVENVYWDCVLAREKIDIYTKSFEIAEQQIAEVRERINVGKVAEIELAASEAEVADKREDLIAARGDLAKRLLLFRRLVNPEGGQWTRDIRFSDKPRQPDVLLDDVEAHVQLGLRYRADLRQAHLQAERGELEVVRTRNGLLPRLDLFVRLGGTHYAGSFPELTEHNDWQVMAGLTLDFAFGLREEKARHRIATLSLEQTQLALANMEQLVQYDVRSAYVQVDVAREQIAATAATRRLRQDTLTAEQEKFRVGTSTTLQVAQAWRDLTASEINEIEAEVSLRKALIDLYRREGTLLERRGIEMPGTNDMNSDF